MEMLIFELLHQNTLPTKILSIGLNENDYRSFSVLKEAMFERVDSGAISTDRDRLQQVEKWRLDTVLYLISHQSAEPHIQDNKKITSERLCRLLDVPSDQPDVVFKNVVEVVFEVAQLLHHQMNIFFFEHLESPFDLDMMNFQDPRQEEWEEKKPRSRAASSSQRISRPYEKTSAQPFRTRASEGRGLCSLLQWQSRTVVRLRETKKPDQ